MIVVISQMTPTKSFYRAYQIYLISRNKKNDSKQIARTATIVEKLKKTFDTVKQREGLRMLTCDKLFIIYSSNGMSGTSSALIWNQTHSCSYINQSFLTEDGKRSDILNVKPNAINELNGLDVELKDLVQKADTTGYFKYVQTHTFPVNTAVQFTVAKKVRGHWEFISSKSFITNRSD